MSRSPEKWFALRTDFFSRDAYLLGIHNLSPAALGLYVISISYACRWGIESCHQGLAAQAGIKRPKAVVDELVANGFWLLAPDGSTLYVQHEGTLWRRGDGVQRRPIPATLRAQVMARDGFACVECSSDRFLSIDHIWPYSKGGADTLDNLRVLCRSCNSSKGDRI